MSKLGKGAARGATGPKLGRGGATAAQEPAEMPQEAVGPGIDSVSPPKCVEIDLQAWGLGALAKRGVKMWRRTLPHLEALKLLNIVARVAGPDIAGALSGSAGGVMAALADPAGDRKAVAQAMLAGVLGDDNFRHVVSAIVSEDFEAWEDFLYGDGALLASEGPGAVNVWAAFRGGQPSPLASSKAEDDMRDVFFQGTPLASLMLMQGLIRAGIGPFPGFSSAQGDKK